MFYEVAVVCVPLAHYSRQTPCKALIMTVDTLQCKTQLFCILGNQLLWAHTHFWHFLSAKFLTVRLSFSVCSCFCASIRWKHFTNTLLFSPLSWCLCSHKNWQTFWRSVTWCSPAFSVSRCCWSSWLWGFLATSKTLIMASTASLSSSGEVLLPSALKLCT